MAGRPEGWKSLSRAGSGMRGTSPLHLQAIRRSCSGWALSAVRTSPAPYGLRKYPRRLWRIRFTPSGSVDGRYRLTDISDGSVTNANLPIGLRSRKKLADNAVTGIHRARGGGQQRTGGTGRYRRKTGWWYR